MNTPAYLKDRIEAALGGRVELDPCSNSKSIIDASVIVVHGRKRAPVFGRAARVIRADGLKVDWHQCTPSGAACRVFVNPPWEDLGPWLAKCEAERRLGAEVVALVPLRPHRTYWNWGATAVAFLPPVRFGSHENGLPTPCVMLYFGRNVARFRAAFVDYCEVFTLTEGTGGRIMQRMPKTNVAQALEWKTANDQDRGSREVALTMLRLLLKEVPQLDKASLLIRACNEMGLRMSHLRLAAEALGHEIDDYMLEEKVMQRLDIPVPAIGGKPKPKPALARKRKSSKSGEQPLPAARPTRVKPERTAAPKRKRSKAEAAPRGEPPKSRKASRKEGKGSHLLGLGHVSEGDKRQAPMFPDAGSGARGEERILAEFLPHKNGEPFSASDIAEQLGVDRVTAHRWLKKLYERKPSPVRHEGAGRAAKWFKATPGHAPN